MDPVSAEGGAVRVCVRGLEQQIEKAASEEEASLDCRRDDAETSGYQSPSGERANIVHARRLGVDFVLDPNEEELIFQSSRIFTIENLEPLKKLRKLSLISNEVTTIEGLEAQASTLEQLELYQNHITRIEHVQILTRLRILDLSFNKIRRIENIEALVNLRELYLSSNKIAKIEGLEILTELRVLELGSNKIRAIEGIDKLTNLVDLWLGKNKIVDLEVPSLPKLERISVQSNRLDGWKTSFFERCPKIRELYLSHNNLPSPPKEISHLAALAVLDLSCNQVTEISAVASLNQLQDFWVNDNKLASFEQCICLQHLPALQTVYLERNPLQADLGPSYRQVVCNALPNLTQLDALLLHTSVKVVEHPENGKAPTVKPIMKL